MASKLAETQQSNQVTQVRYVHGTARASAPRDFDSAELTGVMRTKWKLLQVAWEGATSIA